MNIEIPEAIRKNLETFYLDHIGIAVENLSEARKTYESMGLLCAGEEEVESEKVRVAFFPVGEKTSIELLEPTSSEGAIAKFLKKKGSGGIHHLCLQVGDLKSVSEKLRNEGFRLIYEEPRQGAGGCWVNFIHPKSTGGVLMEITGDFQA